MILVHWTDPLKLCIHRLSIKKEVATVMSANNIAIAGFWSILAITISAFWNQMTQVKTQRNRRTLHAQGLRVTNKDHNL